jgi:hypothetical protein
MAMSDQERERGCAIINLARTALSSTEAVSNRRAG